MELCWNGDAGPIELNTDFHHVWMALDKDGRDVMPDRVIYANDVTGELWVFATREGQPMLVNGELLTMKTRLGSGAFRLSRKGS